MSQKAKIIKCLQDKIEDIPPLSAITRYPSPITSQFYDLSEEEKITFIEGKFREIMLVLGLDLNNESLEKTPYRIAKMYVREIFSGLNPKNFPEISLTSNSFNQEDSRMILVKGITLNTFCEHHFVPIQGKAHIAYIPNKKIIGLSKVNRIVDYFSKRPQIQERLAAQISDSLSIILETQDIALSLSAKHACVSSRGIEDQSSTTTTNVFLGRFQEDVSLKNEFFNNALTRFET